MTRRKSGKSAAANPAAVPPKVVPEPAATDAGLAANPPLPRPWLFALVAVIYACWLLMLVFLAWRAGQVANVITV